MGESCFFWRNDWDGFIRGDLLRALDEKIYLPGAEIVFTKSEGIIVLAGFDGVCALGRL